MNAHSKLASLLFELFFFNLLIYMEIFKWVP